MASTTHDFNGQGSSHGPAEQLLKTPNTQALPIQHGDSDSDVTEKQSDDWKPGYFHQFPWLGLGGLLGVLICSGICVMLVYISNGKAKSEWKSLAPPNVLISVFTSVSSILVTMAVGQGIAISWWRKAMKGATVEDLHSSWSFSSSILSIVTGWKFFNVMAVAALCTKFAIIDSTLYQKALTTRIALGPPHPSDVDVLTWDTFPYTGLLNEAANATSEMSFAMTYDFIGWSKSTIDAGINVAYLWGLADCEGLCNVNYTGVGLASSCTHTNISNVSRDQEAVANGSDILLDIAFTQHWPSTTKNYSYIEMNWLSWVSYSQSDVPNEGCLGDWWNLTCELRPALIEYNLTMQNSSFSQRNSKDKQSNYAVYQGGVNVSSGAWESYRFMDDDLKDNQLPDSKVLKYIDVDEPKTSGSNTTLGGIVVALQTFYNTKSTVSFDSVTSVTNNVTSTRPVSYSEGIQVPYAQLQNFNDGCPTGFTPPLYNENSELYYDIVLANINNLMLMVATDPQLRPDYPASYGAFNCSEADDWGCAYITKHTTSLPMLELKDETYYISKFGFAWGAFASTIVVVLMILPSYWGYWQLGRKVTLGPLEIANAFEAPAFANVHKGAGHVEVVLKEVGKQKVQYGAKGTRYGFVPH